MAQSTFECTFHFSYPLFAKSLIETGDGGYLLTGDVNTLTGISDIYMIKINGAGDSLWTRIVGGQYFEDGFSMNKTSDSGYIMCGMTEDFAGAQALFLTRLDSLGNVLWSKKYMNQDYVYGYYALELSNGDIAAVGTVKPLGSSNYDILFQLTGPNGNLKLSMLYGGSSDDYPSQIIQTSDGNLIINTSTNSFGAGGQDLWLLKIDTSGNVVWSRTVGGPLNDEGYIIETRDHGLAIAGTNWSSNSADLFLAKTDSLGFVQWSYSYGGNGGDGGSFLAETVDSGYIISGATSSFGNVADLFLVKTDRLGNMQWSHTYGDSAIEVNRGGVFQTADQGYLLAGSSESFNALGEEIYLIKTDSNGVSGCFMDSPPSIRSNNSILNMNASVNVTSYLTFASNFGVVSASGCYVNTLCNSTGIKSLSQIANFEIYPNPATNQFGVRSQEFGDNAKLEVYNLLGEKMFSERLNSGGQFTVDCRLFPRGIYFVRLSDTEKLLTQILILE